MAMSPAEKSPKNLNSKVPYKAEAIVRAAHVLALLDRASPQRTLPELAERTGVPKATLLGILNTLVSHDLLRFDAGDGCYRLGFAWLRMGDVRRNQLDIRELAVPLMRRMRDALDETIILSLRVGDRRVHIDYVESMQTIRRIGRLGSEAPLHVGAAGLTLLAGMSPADIEAYLERTPDAATRRDEILNAVAEIRKDGYAVAVGTVNAETAAVAAPVKTSSGETVAALTVSCPRERFTKELRRACVASVIDNARHLSQSLGYRS